MRLLLPWEVPGPGPWGSPGLARRPRPSPAARSQAPGHKRYSGPPSAPRGRLAPPAFGGLGPSAARASPAPSGHRSLRPSLAGSAYRRGGPAPRSAGAPPGGPRLRAWPRPRLRPLRLAPPGASLCLALASPFGAFGLPAGVVGLGPLRAWLCAPGPAPGPPWPAPPPSGGWVLALRGSARLVAPRGRRGPSGRFGRLRRPRGWGTRGGTMPPEGGYVVQKVAIYHDKS